MLEALPLAAVPGCKSATQRALLLAALAEGESLLRGPSAAADCRELREALAALGADVTVAAEDGWRVRGWGGLPNPAGQTLDCGAGASTLRFLLALCAAAEGETRLRADSGLRARPHADFLALLTALGAAIEPQADGWRVRGRGYALREAEVPVDQSSQFLSGLLMASGAQPQRWSFRGSPVSPGYLALTVGMQRVYRGADALQVERDAIEVAAGFGQARDCTIPADASAVLTLAIAAWVGGRGFRLARVWSERHPDAAVLLALRQAGLLRCADDADGGFALWPVAAEAGPAEVGAAAAGEPLACDLNGAPDAGPVLAALGLHLPGGVSLSGVSRLRGKESDRLQGIERLVALVGGRCERHADTLWVRPALAQPRGARSYDPAGDHRLAMAAGIVALRDSGLEVQDRACVAKSFPDFWEQLAGLA